MKLVTALVLTDLAPGSYVVRVQAHAFAPKEYPPITGLLSA